MLSEYDAIELKRNFTSNIIELRMKQGLTQKDVAQRLGIPATTYQNYEKCLREAPYAILVELADLLDTSIDFLMGRTSESSSLIDAVIDNSYLTDEEKAMICTYIDLPVHTRRALMSVIREVMSAYNANFLHIRSLSLKREEAERRERIDQALEETPIISRDQLKKYMKTPKGRELRRRLDEMYEDIDMKKKLEEYHNSDAYKEFMENTKYIGRPSDNEDA